MFSLQWVLNQEKVPTMWKQQEATILLKEEVKDLTKSKSYGLLDVLENIQKELPYKWMAQTITFLVDVSS